MRITKCIILVLFLITTACGQDSIDKSLRRLNDESVPYIYGDDLNSKEVILLDTRKKEEYKISHLNAALWVGYEEFRIDSISKLIPDKDKAVVVYCSIGVRSEDIGEKMIKAGFTNVKNLYGGIFEWKNQGYPVYNPEEMETDSVHAYSKKWGKLLTNAIKVYDD
ncbi:rhodanese-like domain-containing protein [Muriicola sp. Z0-33]|uniref:rhodanese-like domain-containing protein n=1 Tax=Muriicola sp. Z0-33 TaxID=2816957 RepID=UPI002237E299|nr:rhodanese-like domain-containing protein [Muriicola sp. Z0-33]MCW5515121.1 rhodanese-like domain-containing protein [Muriicola sp. Z0-33]